MTTQQTYVIHTSGDEQTDFDAIEAKADELAAAGFEPTDSEPGEWLVMTRGDEEVTIEIGPVDGPSGILVG